MLKRLISLALLMLVSTSAGAFEGHAARFPTASPFATYGIVYIGNLNQTNFSGLPSQYTIALLRIPARTLWTACNGNSSDYTWTTLSSALSSATSNGLKVILDVELGANSPDCELFTRLSGSGASYTTKWAFELALPQNSTTIVPCQNSTIPVPWNSTFQSDAEAFFSAMATEVYTTLGYSQTQIVGVVDTAVSWNDDETTLPAETANTITCTGGGAGTTYALPSNAECT